MKITLLPKTRLGIWAIVITAISWILYVVFSLLPWKEGYSGFEIIIQNPFQAIGNVVILGLGITASIMALIAVIKMQERSILVFLVILSIFVSIFSIVGIVANLFGII